MAKRSSVFINCPFDVTYKPLFDAILFSVWDCGYEPVCALANDDSGRVRVEKIHRLIDSSRFGIHDISRTELDDATKLPRFNMPFELGLFLGSKTYGNARNKRKVTLILDKEPYRYQKFISDIAGQDIHSHKNQPNEAIRVVRNWLQQHVRHGRSSSPLPSGKIIVERYERFRSELAAFAERARLDSSRLTYADYSWLVKAWLESNALATR